MLEMICAVPENIGWVIVGAVGMLCAMMAVKLAKLIIKAIKENKEEEGEN